MEQIQLFLDSCRSKATRETYELLLKKYIDFVGIDNLFVDPSTPLYPGWAKAMICVFEDTSVVPLDHQEKFIQLY